MVDCCALAIILHDDLNDERSPEILEYDVMVCKPGMGRQFVLLNPTPTASDIPYDGMNVQMTVTGWACSDGIAGFRVKLPAGIKPLHTVEGTPCVITSKSNPGYGFHINNYLANKKFQDVTPFKISGTVRLLQHETFDDPE